MNGLTFYDCFAQLKLSGYIYTLTAVSGLRVDIDSIKMGSSSSSLIHSSP